MKPLTLPLCLALLLIVTSACNSTSQLRATDADSPKPVATTAPDAAPEAFAKSGYVTLMEDGRLWVFRAGSTELTAFQKHGELAKHVVRPGAGPAGMTIKAPDLETLQAYLVAKEGFETHIEDGRVWVFFVGSPELAAFKKDGELAKHVVRPGVGPGGMTVKSPDSETLLAYIYAKPGFVTHIEDGRLWVFRAGSPELAAFKKDGELAKHVVRPGAGPRGITLKSPDTEVMQAYQVAATGFVTKIEDGRLWVFLAGSSELQAFEKHGELAKHVVRPGGGPAGMTIKAPDTEVIDRYMRALQN